MIAAAVELAGVLLVGTATLVDACAFRDETVWSGYGSGYGFVPLVLPPLALWWLLRPERTAPPLARHPQSTDRRTRSGPSRGELNAAACCRSREAEPRRHVRRC
jgi:hypothetical protein